jgi:hypothetical protein
MPVDVALQFRDAAEGGVLPGLKRSLNMKSMTNKSDFD